MVDCDAFFVSCEKTRYPDLNGKAVYVLSNNDGCVIARSKEAKKLGIKMGEPFFLAQKEYPQVVFISSDIDFYEKISKDVMNVLSKYTNVMEKYSIDEAFVDLTGLRGFYHKSYEKIAEMIREDVYRELQIPVSIGISETKTLAKLACEKAKLKDSGVYSIKAKNILKEVENVDIAEIWGIGKNTASFLNKLGIYKVYEFLSLSDCFLRKYFNKRIIEIKEELKGNIIYKVTNLMKIPKSIQKTCSFSQFTCDINYIKNCLNFHIHRACRKLRELNMLTCIVTLVLKTKDYSLIKKKYYLESETDWEFHISNKIIQLLNETYDKNILYRSCGVILSGLKSNTSRQLSLFTLKEDIDKIERLENSLDALNLKFGKYILKPGFMYTNIQNKNFLRIK